MKSKKSTIKKERPKEFSDRDLNTLLRFPTISWSSYHAFTEYDKDVWYKQYVLGERSAPNTAMKIGIEVGERIVADPTFLPTLERLDTYERKILVNFSGITIRGDIDGSCLTPPRIHEYKTSTNNKRWTQKKVDEWGQITLYCFLYYIKYKIPPENIQLSLWAIPIVEYGDFTYEAKDPVCFHTKRTMADVLKLAVDIKRVHAEMCEFVRLKELST